MNLYLKAAIITLIIFLIGLFIVQQMDLMRFNELNNKVDVEITQMNETKLLFLFTQLFDEVNPEMCSVLETRIHSQMKKTASLLLELDDSRKKSLLVDYDLMEKKYFLNNAELFLYFKQAEQLCLDTDFSIPILYFYPYNSECRDCVIQASILNKVRDDCNARIFAFPVDLNIEIVSLLKAKYNVIESPSIVINEELFSGLQSEEKIKQLICN